MAKNDQIITGGPRDYARLTAEQDIYVPKKYRKVTIPMDKKTVQQTCKEKGFASLTDKQKERMITKAEKHMKKYMTVLFPGWENDPNMSDTPRRVTKAYIDDLCKSLYNPFPKITAFDNVDGYKGIVLQSNIPIQSLCSHHLQNIFGFAHVAYIPSEGGKIVGLSKLNRIVEYLSKAPQVQENLTQQIHNMVDKMCEKNKGVAVIVKAKHMCVGHRGVNHKESDMSTAVLSGDFQLEQKVRDEFYKLVEFSNK